MRDLERNENDNTAARPVTLHELIDGQENLQDSNKILRVFSNVPNLAAILCLAYILPYSNNIEDFEYFENMPLILLLLLFSSGLALMSALVEHLTAISITKYGNRIHKTGNTSNNLIFINSSILHLALGFLSFACDQRVLECAGITEIGNQKKLTILSNYPFIIGAFAVKNFVLVNFRQSYTVRQDKQRIFNKVGKHILAAEQAALYHLTPTLIMFITRKWFMHDLINENIASEAGINQWVMGRINTADYVNNWQLIAATLHVTYYALRAYYAHSTTSVDNPISLRRGATCYKRGMPVLMR